jgi:hypothetical protein
MLKDIPLARISHSLPVCRGKASRFALNESAHRGKHALRVPLDMSCGARSSYFECLSRLNYRGWE